MFIPLIIAAAALIGGAACGAAGYAITTGIIFIAEITISAIKKKMLERNCRKAMVKSVNTCTNQVKLEDMETGDAFEIKGNRISDDIRQNQVITC